MKHFLSNALMMSLLVGLLIVPLTGFYLFGYNTNSNPAYKIPDYVPIKIANPGNSEVLSEQDIRSDSIVESSEEDDLGQLESSTELQYKGEDNDEIELVEDPGEFDPTNYSPANNR